MLLPPPLPRLPPPPLPPPLYYYYYYARHPFDRPYAYDTPLTRSSHVYALTTPTQPINEREATKRPTLDGTVDLRPLNSDGGNKVVPAI